MKTFVDNVAAQAVEASLLSGLSEILSPTSILEMGASLIASIAGEPEDSQVEREQLSRKLTVLRSGLDICKRFASRPPRKTVHKDATTTQVKKGDQLPSPNPIPQPKIEDHRPPAAAGTAPFPSFLGISSGEPTPPPSTGATPPPVESKPKAVAEPKPLFPTGGFQQHNGFGQASGSATSSSWQSGAFGQPTDQHTWDFGPPKGKQGTPTPKW
jgi:hypothetical protein